MTDQPKPTSAAEACARDYGKEILALADATLAALEPNCKAAIDIRNARDRWSLASLLPQPSAPTPKGLREAVRHTIEAEFAPSEPVDWTEALTDSILTAIGPFVGEVATRGSNEEYYAWIDRATAEWDRLYANDSTPEIQLLNAQRIKNLIVQFGPHPQQLTAREKNLRTQLTTTLRERDEARAAGEKHIMDIWLRCLGDQVYPKSHFIDSLGKTTRKLTEDRNAAQAALNLWREFGKQYTPANVFLSASETPDHALREQILKSTTSATQTIHQFINEVHDLKAALQANAEDKARLDFVQDTGQGPTLGAHGKFVQVAINSNGMVVRVFTGDNARSAIDSARKEGK